MKPVLAASISLILSGSALILSGSAFGGSPPLPKPMAVRKSVLTGNTIPVLMGLGATIALGIVVTADADNPSERVRAAD